MRALGLIRQATAAPRHDLWPRLRARLADDEHVALRMPAFGWHEATALVLAVGIVVVVPDPLSFLAASGIF
jgi:hypothetical protein